jgi:hypothetical protein
VRRAVLLLAVPVLSLLGASSSAAPTRDGIVIRSADSGSHLRLTVRGEQLFVNGRMQPSRPRGCRLIAGLRVAACRLTGTGSVTIEMGPSNDKIEVIDRLPVPLVAYLGSGSDKLIGNGERDLCYPQGSRRNRCIGNGGNDVCISGPKNTDCVGGPGDDYCETSNGSDGVLGRPRPRRLRDGRRPGRLSRRPRQRPAARRPGAGPALRRQRSRLLQRRQRGRAIARLRVGAAALISLPASPGRLRSPRSSPWVTPRGRCAR